MEAGERWMLPATDDQAVRSWTAETMTSQRIRRAASPIERFVYGNSAASDPRTLGVDVQFEKIEYGESQAKPESLNVRIRIFRHSDTAGVATNGGLDSAGNFLAASTSKGNLLRSSRQLIQDDTKIPTGRKRRNWPQRLLRAASATTRSIACPGDRTAQRSGKVPTAATHRHRAGTPTTRPDGCGVSMRGPDSRPNPERC